MPEALGIISTTTGRIVLFLHVLSAVALLGPTFVLPFTARLRGKPLSVPLLKAEAQIGRMVTLFALVQAATGAWLIWLGHWNKHFGAAKWLHVSIVVFVIAAGLGTGYAEPRGRRALARAEQGDDDGAEALLAPVDRIVGPILAVLSVSLVFLMVYKPWQG